MASAHVIAARKDPKRTTRGAAVNRAKQRLGDALDAALVRAGFEHPDDGHRLPLLARGVWGEAVYRRQPVLTRLFAASLADLEAWTAAVEKLEPGKVRAACEEKA